MWFRIEVAGTQSLAGALPVHSLSCKTVDDLTILSSAHDLKVAMKPANLFFLFSFCFFEAWRTVIGG